MKARIQLGVRQPTSDLESASEGVNETPLAATLTGANRSDVTQLLVLVDRVALSLGGAEDPGAAPTRFSRIMAMTTTSTAASYANEGSSP